MIEKEVILIITTILALTQSITGMYINDNNYITRGIIFSAATLILLAK